MTLKLILDLVQFVVVIATVILLVKSILLRRKVKAFFEKMKIEYGDVNKRRSENDESIKIINERLNLLSKENVKLRSENEELKDRLRNMGIRDFDVIN